MRSLRKLLPVVGLLSGVALAAGAAAQSGAKPIRFIVPYAAGGAVDVYARSVAGPMSKALNQTIVIENLGGAGGNIGVARVAKAAPDGETLLFHNMAMATNPSLYRKLDYNPLTDFEYVGVAAHSIMAMVGRPDLPVENLKQFIPYARANGDKITIGDGGVGGPTNLCALLFMSAIGTKFTIVSYKGGAPALNDVMGRQIDLVCDGTATTANHIAAGKVKALGVSSKARLRSMPNVPTLAEGGLPGVDMSNWNGLLAPAGTPKEIIDKIAAEIARILAMPDIRKTLLAQGDEPFVSTPEKFAALIKADLAKYAKIINTANIKVEQ